MLAKVTVVTRWDEFYLHLSFEMDAFLIRCQEVAFAFGQWFLTMNRMTRKEPHASLYLIQGT